MLFSIFFGIFSVVALCYILDGFIAFEFFGNGWSRGVKIASMAMTLCRTDPGARRPREETGIYKEIPGLW